MKDGQDVAEYAIIRAVVLILALAATGLIGASSNQVYSRLSDLIAQL